MLGDTPHAKQLQLESLALCRACGDDRGMAEALDALGDSAALKARWTKPRPIIARAWRCAGGWAMPTPSAWRCTAWDGWRSIYGSLLEAQPLLGEALTLLRRIGDPRGVALSLNGLGRAALRRGEPAEARSAYRAALVTFAELGNRIDIPECLEELALVAEASGQALRAARLLGAASAMRNVTGARFSVDEQAGSGRFAATYERRPGAKGGARRGQSFQPRPGSSLLALSDTV